MQFLNIEKEKDAEQFLGPLGFGIFQDTSRPWLHAEARSGAEHPLAKSALRPMRVAEASLPIKTQQKAVNLA